MFSCIFSVLTHLCFSSFEQDLLCSIFKIVEYMATSHATNSKVLLCIKSLKGCNAQQLFNNLLEAKKLSARNCFSNTNRMPQPSLKTGAFGEETQSNHFQTLLAFFVTISLFTHTHNHLEPSFSKWPFKLCYL